MLIGCGIALALGCSTLPLSPLLYIDRVNFINRDVVAVLLQVVVWLVTGYGTARAAIWKKVPVNLHVFGLGVFLMLVQIVVGVLQLTTDEIEIIERLPYSFSQLLLTVPLMLIGAMVARWQCKTVSAPHPPDSTP